MAITFDLNSSDHSGYRLSQFRLLLGDTTESGGPRPGGQNFQDEELNTFLLLEDDDLNRAVALGFETLAGEWARLAGSYGLGPESETTRQSDTFAARAAALRSIYGYTAKPAAEVTAAAAMPAVVTGLIRF